MKHLYLFQIYDTTKIYDTEVFSTTRIFETTKIHEDEPPRKESISKGVKPPVDMGDLQKIFSDSLRVVMDESNDRLNKSLMQFKEDILSSLRTKETSSTGKEEHQSDDDMKSYIRDHLDSLSPDRLVQIVELMKSDKQL